MAKRGLGKGLNELLKVSLPEGDVAVAEKPVDAKSSSGASDRPKPSVTAVEILPIHALEPGPYQPRTLMGTEALEQLAESIAQQGIIQPIVVRPADDTYQILAGERRWRAAQKAELTEVPVIVREVSDDVAMAIGLIENIQREDLNPIDTAKGLKRLAEAMSLTHLQVAEAVGKSRAAVTNLLRLLTLVPDVQALLESGDIEVGHAKALLGVKETLQLGLARSIIKRGLSVRETERITQRIQNRQDKERAARAGDPNIRRLESDLTDKLGSPVHIRHTAKGKGSLVIQYNDTEQLEGILDHFR